MDFEKVSLFPGYCPIFEENRTIPIHYYDNLGNLSGRKYMHYDNCIDCPLSHNFNDPDDCCPIFNSKIRN